MQQQELGGFSGAVDSLHYEKFSGKAMLAIPFHQDTPHREAGFK